MIYKIYLWLPNLQKPVILHKTINRVYLFLFKRLFNDKMARDVEDPKNKIHLGVNNKPRNYTIDVSLTSFPARISEVSTTVETIFQQTEKADSITLWLSKEQFPEQKIPDKLTEQTKRGLTIEFVEDDLRSHKKYYYAFKKQSNNLVITLDDDVFYPKHTIHALIQAHLKYPNAIICNRGHQINTKQGDLLKYRSWSHNFKNIVPSFSAVPTGVGGVLYPPNSYSSDIFDIDTFKKICYHADDLWLKIHSLRAGIKVFCLRTFSRDLINVGKSQDFKLVQHNAIKGGNDVQLKNLMDYYQLTEKSFNDAT